MYTPPAFRDEDPISALAAIASTGLATLVTQTADGMIGTPLPMLFVKEEGPSGAIYGHLARTNQQATQSVVGEALAIFHGPDAYVSPGWYPSKAAHGRVVPTWNYVALHAYGELEFFDDVDRLGDMVHRLTTLHETGRSTPWAVSDAPDRFIAAQLRGIIGLRLEISRIDAKRKLSQNRDDADRAGVQAGLLADTDAKAYDVADLMGERS